MEDYETKEPMSASTADELLFVPDGWDGTEEGFFAAGDPVGGDAELEKASGGTDGSTSEAPTPDTGRSVEPEPAPTTGGTEAPVQSDAGTETEEPDGVTPEVPEPAAKRQVPYRYNHQSGVLDVGSLSDDQIAAMYQKSLAFDDRCAADKRATWDTVYQEELDAGMTERSARLAATAAAGEDFSESDNDGGSAVAESTPSGATTDFAADLATLRNLYPDLGELPTEVVTQVLSGQANLIPAYLAWKDNQTSKTVAAVQRENTILKQQQAAAERAPSVSVTKGPATKSKPDPMLEAFDEALMGM